MQLPSLTVFTPSYNRALLLPRLYRSLCEQSCLKFKWLIIDDGSTDNTSALISKWQAENNILIEYIYKPNGGFHTAHNLAYQNIKTELSVCIDSDDLLPLNAIEDILSCWSNIPNKEGIAGMIGLDKLIDGDIIGTNHPENIRIAKRSDLYQKYKVKGDKKIVLRMDVVKKYPPCPEFKGEKFVPETTLYTLIDQDYDFYLFDRVWCIVDYQNDGLSNTIIEQYFLSPKGFLYTRLLNIKYGRTRYFRLRNIIHYINCCIILRDFKIIKEVPYPKITFCLIPVGFLLHIFLQIKRKKFKKTFFGFRNK